MSPPKNTTATEVKPAAPPGVLRVADVAKMWGVQPGTVSAYIKESKATVGARPGRYAGNPMPTPSYMGASKKGPWWPKSQEKALMDWFNSRPGLGHGTGGRRAGSSRKAVA